jgi:hypothetical protein
VDLQSVTDALYDAPLDDFINRRDEQLAAAKAAGDTRLAAEIKSLRRPSVGAWLVNLLVRRCTEDVETLLAMADKLRAAHDLHGDELRTLLSSRRESEARLLDAAKEIAADHDQKVSQSGLGEVRASFEAALADPEAAELILSGQLVKPLGYGDYADVLAAPGVTGKPAASQRRRRTPADPKPSKSKPSKSAGSKPAVAVAPPPAKVRAAKERLAKAERQAQAATARVEAADRDRQDAEAHVDETHGDVADLERFLRNRQSDLKMAERNVAAATQVLSSARQKADDTAKRLAEAQAAVAELS